MSTNLTKWDDTGNELTAFCNDDTGDTEIGLAKWDDTNNRLEINCNSVDAIVKWDDAGNNLESRTTDDGCCEGACEACTVNYVIGMPRYIKVTITGVLDCGDVEDVDCTEINGTYVLECFDYYGLVRWQWTNGYKQIFFYYQSAPPYLTKWVDGRIDNYNCYLGWTLLYEICSGETTTNYSCSTQEGYDGAAVWVACDSFGNECEC